MKCLSCLNFVTAHAFLTGWYLFHIFHSCTILVYSIGPNRFLLHLARFQHLIWASLIRKHRSKLEVEAFIFYVVVFFRETLQTLAWKFLLCVPQKVFGVYIFPNFVQHVIVQTYQNRKLNIPIKPCQSKEKIPIRLI